MHMFTHFLTFCVVVILNSSDLLANELTMMFARLFFCLSVRPSICLSGTGVHSDHTVHCTAT